MSIKTGDIKRVKLKSGHEVVTYSIGEGGNVLLCANGGPGLPCDYIRDSHYIMAEEGFRVVTWDQLGCGKSDRPNNNALWTVERYVEEVEEIRLALDLGKVHFLGQSWGTWLGIEYALKYQSNLKSLILANGAADIPHLISELNRLKASLGAETVTMMQRREAENTIEHPEYQAAITLLNYRHVCRLDKWPDAVNRSLDDWNQAPYVTMQGPNEFTYTGNMKDWNRCDELHNIKVPSLILVGQYDELTPACSAKINDNLANSQIHVFKESSHMPFYEQPSLYFSALTKFLKRVAN
ncbi:proline iminopeptidase-family hydrolase [Colwellia sp. E150_009]